uniref:Gem-associated protein 2 n=1 Tax=Acrobeloides nanus TaxID=290746 RepID=A0A914D8T5_9BILA
MEQGVFFEVGDFDRSKVNLDKTATSAEEFLKQMIVGREQCPEVIKANLDPQKLKPPSNQIPLDPSRGLVCPLAPGKEWANHMSNDFSMKRSLLEGRRNKISKIKGLDLPQPECASKWRQIVLEQRLPAVEIPPELEASFAHHKGTPPTLRLIISLTDVQVNSLIQNLIEHFVENGYSRPLFEWIHSLLLVVNKPLLQDVCSSLRAMSRQCRILRSTLGPNDMVLIREFTLFIALVSIYFGQKDLAD